MLRRRPRLVAAYCQRKIVIDSRVAIVCWRVAVPFERSQRGGLEGKREVGAES